MVRTITLLARSCRWCKPPSPIPGRNSSDQTDNFDSPLQVVESDIKIPVQIIESTVDVVCKRSHRGIESDLSNERLSRPQMTALILNFRLFNSLGPTNQSPGT